MLENQFLLYCYTVVTALSVIFWTAFLIFVKFIAFADGKENQLAIGISKSGPTTPTAYNGDKNSVRPVGGIASLSIKNRPASYGNMAKASQNIFKQMDAQKQEGRKLSAPAGAPRNPASIKDALLRWCQSKTRDYEHVSITNFSSSWCDGMAFCALIHHFCPEAFDYSKLDPKNRKENFELAFHAAEEHGGIVPLLEVQDMLDMGERPDWKCVFTYVQSFYGRFKNQD